MDFSSADMNHAIHNLRNVLNDTQHIVAGFLAQDEDDASLKEVYYCLIRGTKQTIDAIRAM